MDRSQLGGPISKTMEIHATQYLKVHISDHEQQRIVLDYLYKHFKWGENFYIKDGNVMECVEHCGSHCWDEQEFRREATDEDYFVAGIIKIFKKIA